MKREAMYDILKDINEKFYKTDVESVSEYYYDGLHAIVLCVIREFTEEEFNSVPAPMRIVVNTLDKEILKYCSKEYRDELNKHLEENGRFYKKKDVKPEDKIKIITKCKQPIGYIVQADEELKF